MWQELAGQGIMWQPVLPGSLCVPLTGCSFRGLGFKGWSASGEQSRRAGVTSLALLHLLQPEKAQVLVSLGEIRAKY